MELALFQKLADAFVFLIDRIVFAGLGIDDNGDLSKLGAQGAVCTEQTVIRLRSTRGEGADAVGVLNV